MKNIAPYKVIILLLTIVLISGSLFWVKYTISRKEVKAVTNIFNKDFNEEHFNYIVLDTFTYLLHKAYGDNISVSIEKTRLKVVLRNAGAVTKDFFNGNDKIPDLALRDFGFKIDYSKSENKIDATFVISNGAVPVPNDVMIKLVDKNYNR